MMQESLAQALEDLHSRIADVVLGLDDDVLRWPPAPGIPSVYDLVTRAAELEYHWMAEGVAEVDRVAVSESSGLAWTDVPANHPLFRLGSAGQLSQVILASLQRVDWSAERVVDGRTLSVAGCVLLTLEELARTLGQIQVVAQLLRPDNRT